MHRRYGETLEAQQGTLMAWERLTECEAGRFLHWCDAAGITETRKGWAFAEVLRYPIIEVQRPGLTEWVTRGRRGTGGLGIARRQTGAGVGEHRRRRRFLVLVAPARGTCRGPGRRRSP